MYKDGYSKEKNINAMFQLEKDILAIKFTLYISIAKFYILPEYSNVPPICSIFSGVSIDSTFSLV